MDIRKKHNSLQYSHIHNKKQRKIKINEISNYVRKYNINYSLFISNLYKNNFKINKKSLLNICISENYTINSLIKILNV